MKFYKTDWYEHKPIDDNNGYIYGIEYYDNDENFIDIEWFKTEKERDENFQRLVKALVTFL